MVIKCEYHQKVRKNDSSWLETYRNILRRLNCNQYVLKCFYRAVQFRSLPLVLPPMLPSMAAVCNSISFGLNFLLNYVEARREIRCNGIGIIMRHEAGIKPLFLLLLLRR